MRVDRLLQNPCNASGHERFNRTVHATRGENEGRYALMNRLSHDPGRETVTEMEVAQDEPGRRTCEQIQRCCCRGSTRDIPSVDRREGDAEHLTKIGIVFHEQHVIHGSTVDRKREPTMNESLALKEF